jgi:NAD+ kinase
MVSEARIGSVGLVLHPVKPVDQSLETILAFAARLPIRVLARERDRDRVPPGVEIVADERFLNEVDGVIALGGDGTMLGAMRLTAERPVPVLGVNHGNLGFLVEVAPSELPAALERMAAGDFTVEQYGCLEVTADRRTHYAFNDLVLSRPGRGTVSVDLEVNDLQYGYYRGDAVIVATPAGSTAYNYAAGGPVLSPSSGALVVTPVAPMAGISRAVVLGAGDRVALTIADDTTAAVDIDGTPAGELGPGSRLVAAMRPDAAQVVRFSASAHANRSRVKLSLLDLPLRRDQLLELIPPELRHRAKELEEG